MSDTQTRPWSSLAREAIRAAADGLRKSEDVFAKFRQAYYSNPDGFALECVRWDADQRPTEYQLAILRDVLEHHRVAVRGPHGLGKTTIAALLVLWFALTREGDDWKVLTTASAWRQLSKYLWPEIGKWAKRVRWDIIGREPLTNKELMTLSLRLGTGEAFALASDNHELIEGAHADHILYVFDEAKAIPIPTWDAAEGALSGAGGDTVHEALALAISTPGEPQGRFHDIFQRKIGFEDWHTRHVRLEDAINAGRISRTWAEQRRRQWGEESAVYQNRVLGEFATSDADGVIPLSWVEAAMDRFPEWDRAGRPGEVFAVGVDVARSGRDQTVLAIRKGTAVEELRKYNLDDTMQTAGHVAAILDAYSGVTAIVDVIGLGAGVVDRLRELNYKVLAFNSSESTTQRDRSGELGFRNTRSAAWWRLRELLDPEREPAVILPPDDELLGDLTAPRWRIGSTGRIEVESKDDIRKRLGRSTDCGDALVMVFSALASGNDYGVGYRTVERRRSTFPRRVRGWARQLRKAR